MEDRYRMMHQLNLKVGDLPWSPSDSECVEVLRYYDAPTVGILRQGDRLFLFQAMVDVPDGSGLWVYNPLTESQSRAVCTDNDEVFDDLTHNMALYHAGVIAVVAGDHVVATEPVNPAEERPLLEAFRRAVARLSSNHPDEDDGAVGRLAELIPA